VIGNPPYKEKAKGRGGWIEDGEQGGPAKNPAPLDRWMPPREWGVGAHSKHLKNLYVYFWRWATWKVFGSCHHAGKEAGKTGRHRLLHHRGRLPQRSRLPEDARLSAPRPATTSG
jgi:hypothetical protein